MTKIDKLADFYDTTDLSSQIVHADTPPDTGAPGEPMEAFTVRLPAKLLDNLRAQAADQALPTGQLIRNLLESAIADQIDNDQTITVAQLRRLIASAH